ncbi:MAG: porin [Phycisphaerae bacterium]
MKHLALLAPAVLTRKKHRAMIVALLFLILPAASLCYGESAQSTPKLDQALAGGETLPAASGTPMEQRMSKMEELLKQQRQEIETLHKQLSGQAEGRLNKARSDEIRQMVKDILSDEKFRNEVYQPSLTAGYDHGFYIKSPDDAFYLKTRIKTQFRYTGVSRDHRDANFFGNKPLRNRSAFEWERLRLYFTGWLWDKKLNYTFSMEQSTNNGGNNVRLYDGYFDYEYMKDQKVRWGQFKLPFGKASQIVSAYNQMFVENSTPTEFFAPGHSLGIMAHGDLFKNKLSYMVGAFNGVKNTGDDATLLDSQLAASGRLIYHVLPGYDDGDETDLAYHQKPAMDIGGSFLYNQNDGDIGGGNGRNQLSYAVQDLIRGGRGGYGLSPDVGSEIIQLGAHVGFKYKGLSLAGEYYFRNINSDHSWSPWNRLTGGDGEGTGSPQGGYVQAGYFIIPKKLEVAARLGGIWAIGDDRSTEETVGVNYYIHGQALKISGDITHIDEVPIANKTVGVDLNDKNVWMYRLQVQATMD